MTIRVVLFSFFSGLLFTGVTQGQEIIMGGEPPLSCRLLDPSRGPGGATVSIHAVVGEMDLYNVLFDGDFE